MANLSLIEEYARKLEQEQMDVADATHSDPNSAEEGRRQFYENNPAMKRYRHRQAQGKALRDSSKGFGSIIADTMSGLEDIEFEAWQNGLKLLAAQENQQFHDDINKGLSQIVDLTPEQQAQLQAERDARQAGIDPLIAKRNAYNF